MSIVGGFDVHRKQITFDYLDTVTGEVQCGQVTAADRRRLATWLQRFAGRDDVAFAAEACTGWRYVVEELTRAGSPLIWPTRPRQRPRADGSGERRPTGPTRG